MKQTGPYPDMYQFDTLSLHAGQNVESEHGSRAVPIHQTTSYVFKDIDHAAMLFNFEQGGHIYSRISNPTVAVFEARMSALEGGVGAVATASGMSSIFVTLATLCSAGDHIVASSQLYGGTLTLLKNTLPRFGIETSFVAPGDTAGFAKAIKKNTKCVLGEIIGNPGLNIIDLEALSKITSEEGIPLIIDATFNTPYLCRPIDYGVDIVIHSATKWIGGHGTTIGGVVIDAGKLDWSKSGRFPTLTEPYAPFHGLNFWEDFGPNAFLTRMRAESMRDFGPALSPHNAFMLLQGLETLSLRMDKHLANTRALAEYLEKHEQVAWVRHPDLPTHPDYSLAKKYLPKGAGSILTFGLKGGYQSAEVFISSTKLASHLANVGDAKTLILHPASTTHSRLDAEALLAAGISEDLVRVSVGIENFADIKKDFDAALNRVARLNDSKNFVNARIAV